MVVQATIQAIVKLIVQLFEAGLKVSGPWHGVKRWSGTISYQWSYGHGDSAPAAP
jgi:hypothetical protein